jgi:hypothetical protein
MTYRLKIQALEDIPDKERVAAEQRFRQALENALGDANVVIPVYAAYLRITAVHGENVDNLSDAERTIVEQWQKAESAAIVAAFGPHRYMDDATYEILF